MSVIRVLIHKGENQEHQLAEIKIERLQCVYMGTWEYVAEIAVDRGSHIHLFNRTFVHVRDQENILGLLESLVLQLTEEEMTMLGRPIDKPNRSMWKELGM